MAEGTRGAISIRLDIEEFGVPLSARLRLGEKEIRLAKWRAMQRALEQARTLVSKRLRETYYIKKSELDPAFKVHPGRPGEVTKAFLEVRGVESPPLSKFSPHQGKTYVSVKVLRAHRARRIRPGGKHEIAATRKGHAAVWLAKGHILARSDKEDRPLALFGPSFMAFFRRPRIADELADATDANYEKRLKVEIAQRMRKAGFK